MIREAVEIGKGERVETHCRSSGDSAPFGTADDCTSSVEMRASAAAAREDEAPQGIERCVHRIDLLLDAVDLRLDDAERHIGRSKVITGGRDVGAEIKQFVLDAREHLARFVILDMEKSNADRAVSLVHITDRSGSGMGLGDTRTVGEASLAGIAGARIDFVEPDQRQPPLASIRSSTTRMIASAWNMTRLRIKSWLR